MKDNFTKSLSPRPSLKCVVYGHYGGKNTGDEAMLLALVCELLKYSEAYEVVIFGKEETQAEFLQRTGSRYVRYSIASLCVAIARSDVLVLGGGTHFHDDYMGRRYFRHLLYMMRIVLFSAFARAIGRRSYWVGVGIGPLRTRLGFWIARTGLALQDGCSVRDQKSVETAESLKLHQKVVKAFDLAALLVPKPPSSPPSKILGISLTWAVTSQRGEVPLGDIIAEAVHKQLNTETDWLIRVFVIRGGEREDDHQISSSFRNRINEFLPNLKIELVQYTEDPEVALSEIAACSHFIATRFHSAVFAYVGQCRMLIVEYHRKLTDFADEIGLSRDFVITNEEVTDKAIVQRKIQGLLSSEAGQKLLPVKDARALAERNFSFFRGNV